MALILGIAPHCLAAGGSGGKEKTSRISDESIPLIDPEEFPERPRPIIELGNPFLGSGRLSDGVTLPGGSVWQPSFIVFGTFRTALQAFNQGEATTAEWVNRLDLFGNLQLSGTERFLFGVRPLDKNGEFTGYRFREEPSESMDAVNGNVETLFFEGDLGELFPALDPADRRSYDWGFAVGRQPVFLQEGMLINDAVDSIGFTRNTLLPRGGSDLQLTFLYGANDVHRDDNLEDTSADLLAVSVAADYPVSTFNADVALIFDTDDDSDGAYWGVSGVQRLGHWNTSFRLLGSHALEEESDAVSDGYLLFAESSWTPPWTHDLLYFNGFWGIDNFSSAARGPATGGPLGRTGILFAALGIGDFGAALGNRADESAGAAVGYQLFSHHTRQQVVLELGGRFDTGDSGEDSYALGARYQRAFGRRTVLQFDAFSSIVESGDDGWGTRAEVRVSF